MKEIEKDDADTEEAKPSRRMGMRVRQESRWKRTPYRKDVKVPKAPSGCTIKRSDRQKFYNWLKDKDNKVSLKGYTRNFTRASIEGLLQKGGWLKNEVNLSFIF